MMDEEVLQILCCPESHQPLEWASEALLDRINGRIAKGELKNRKGEIVTEPLEAGLVRQDGEVVYPVRQGIPVLLIEEAIEVEQTM